MFPLPTGTLLSFVNSWHWRDTAGGRVYLKFFCVLSACSWRRACSFLDAQSNYSKTLATNCVMTFFVMLSVFLTRLLSMYNFSSVCWPEGTHSPVASPCILSSCGWDTFPCAAFLLWENRFFCQFPKGVLPAAHWPPIEPQLPSPQGLDLSPAWDKERAIFLRFSTLALRVVSAPYICYSYILYVSSFIHTTQCLFTLTSRQN